MTVKSRWREGRRLLLKGHRRGEERMTPTASEHRSAEDRAGLGERVCLCVSVLEQLKCIQREGLGQPALSHSQRG